MPKQMLKRYLLVLLTQVASEIPNPSQTSKSNTWHLNCLCRSMPVLEKVFTVAQPRGDFGRGCWGVLLPKSDLQNCDPRLVITETNILKRLLFPHNTKRGTNLQTDWACRQFRLLLLWFRGTVPAIFNTRAKFAKVIIMFLVDLKTVRC